MEYWPVAGNKFVGYVRKGSDDIVVQPTRHHVWIYDRSGSMGWVIAQLAEDVCVHLDEIPSGDFVSVGWFSSPGEFRWFVKGAKLTSKSSYEDVKKVVRANATSLGTTCFSEILADVPAVIKDVAPVCNNVSIVFLSDGHPVVPNYEKERKAIFNALGEIKGVVSSGLLVGYGDYYNKPLMAEMAKALGATLQHADSVKDFSKQLGEVVVKVGRKRTTVTIPVGVDGVFTVENGKVVVYEVSDNKAVVPDGVDVYFAATPSKMDKPTNGPTKQQDPYRAEYGAAAMYLQQGNTELALDILGNIGDIAIVEKLGNALTNKEVADAVDMINAAATDLTKRFLKGQKRGCVPSENAYDLIDLLMMLQSDSEAKFYPYHPDFEYKRIGRKSKPAEGYPKFVAVNQGVDISRIVGHSTELNISVGVTIDGTVDLPKEAAGLKLIDVGLPQTYPAHIFRTYNLVSNALPNVTKLPVSVSEDSFVELRAAGLISSKESWEAGKIFTLDLLSIPACNRARGKAASDWNSLGKMAVRSSYLGNLLKVYKAKLNELDPNKEAKRPVTVTAEQEKFLAACGIKADGTYDVPSTQDPATDVLTVRTMEIKVAKSSPVSMSDFELMESGKKKTNWVGEQMLIAASDIGENMPQKTGAAIAWLSECIEELTVEKRMVDASIAAQKYAIALGGQWSKSHSSDTATYDIPLDEKEFAAANAEVTFKFSETTKKI